LIILHQHYHQHHIIVVIIIIDCPLELSRVNCCDLAHDVGGETENARTQNAAPSKNVRVENARLENAAPVCRGGDAGPNAMERRKCKSLFTNNMIDDKNAIMKKTVQE